MTLNVAGVQPTSRLHRLSLVVAVTIMLACSLYPPLMTAPDGKADHALATALFIAMSVAFVRGVGFIPRRPVWRRMFSGWTCLVALALAGGLKLLH
ncbi:cyd operon YbgE family protein [Pseudomonas sp. 3JA]|uniref:cyd operon YbgE family protein n=1 Tax=Pseudomonas sp. 3JA TaxID=3109347 RepID=UPI00300B3CE8